DVLDRMRRIADILVERRTIARVRVPGRGTEAQAAMRLEEQRPGPDGAGRPVVERPPLVGPGLEDPGLREVRGVLPFQVLLEERELDAIAEELPGLGVERHV